MLLLRFKVIHLLKVKIVKRKVRVCLSEIYEVPLLIISGHRVTLLGLRIPVKVLGVDEVANTWYPGWIYATIKDHSPINTSEPLVSLDFFRTVLKIIRQVRKLK